MICRFKEKSHIATENIGAMWLFIRFAVVTRLFSLAISHEYASLRVDDRPPHQAIAP